MGTIKIGSSANRKGITVEPSVVLFNGSNVKKIMRGLTTIWEDIKALVPPMTSNTTPVGEVIAISSHNNNPAYYAFDDSLSTLWGSNSTSTPVWVGYKFENSVCAKKATVIFDYSSTYYVTSCTYKYQASNDNSEWVDISPLITIGSQSGNSNGCTDVLNNSKNYLYYRIYITEQTINSAIFKGSIFELQFYGR